jgi:four helix bundle protein
MSGTYEDLRVWQIAMELVFDIYRATRSFPDEEKYGLTSQIRRAAVSVASNIAEGKGRASDRELMQFLSVARGSLYEVQTQLVIAEKLGYLSHKQNEALRVRAVETGRLLSGLVRSFRPLVQPLKSGARLWDAEPT